MPIPTLILHTSLLQPHQMTSISIEKIKKLNANGINNRAVQFHKFFCYFISICINWQSCWLLYLFCNPTKAANEVEGGGVFFQPWKLNYRWITAILLQIHQPPTSSKPAKCVVCWVCVVDCCVLVDFATNITEHRQLIAGWIAVELLQI